MIENNPFILKNITTEKNQEQKPTVTFKSYSTYADFGMFVAAFVALVGGHGGTFSVSLVSFFYSGDFSPLLLRQRR